MSEGAPLPGLEGASGPLRVGIDGRELQGQPTGVGRYLRNLLRAWPHPEDDLLLYLRGQPLTRLPSCPARLVPRVLDGGRGPGVLWQERELARAAGSDRLDVFLGPGYTCPLRVRVPCVVVVHDVSFFLWPEDFSVVEAARRRLLVGASLDGASRVLTVSDFSRREILAVRPGVASRVAVVPHGADDDLPPAPGRDGARRRLDLRGPLLITVGSIFNRRRVPELLRATARLTRLFPDLVLDVVGDNRTHPRLDLGTQARELGLSRQVRFSGFVDEAGLADRYAAADLAVFLSEYEGFGLPALEAAARGLPLLVSSKPALGEIFGQAALTVDPQDVEAIAAAAARALQEPGLHDDLVRRGLDLAARHTWAAAAGATRALLAEAARP